MFHQLVGELETFTASDDEALAALLPAGIHDVRTDIYMEGSFHAVYRGLQRGPFVSTLVAASDWIRDDGVMPLFAYTAATREAPCSRAAVDLAADYLHTVARIVATLADPARTRFSAVIAAYRSLYAARTAYDIFEYFGFYSFVRHVVILRTVRALTARDPGVARDFQYLASTYRFGEARRLLNDFLNGG